MSSVLRKRPPSSPTQPNFSKKQRFIDAVKALLDIAKESSDAFPPLKSCLGGINALIKHYDQYNDVKDKLADLIPWLEKLLKSLAKVNPDDDREEVERRSQLAKTLEDIGTRSLALSEKGKVARVLDKAQDAQEVVKLVERLRQAILVYQVSQQQSIYNQVVHMAASFDVLLKLHQKSPVKSRMESVRARLDRFGKDADASGDADEFRRRKTLFEALEGIKDKLQILSEHSDTAEHVEEADRIAVCDLADDLRDVIVEYQVAQQKAIYKQNSRLIGAAELSVLNSCRRAAGAHFGFGDRKGCLKGTREDVLDEIESWSKDPNMSPVYWLNGLAGTGKSTIAQTIAERVFADGRLGASFFCSRDFKDRRNLRYIFPTLSFQLAHRYPEFRSILVPLLQSNPDVVHDSLYNQMEGLIVEPLGSSNISTVIIIDALDECADDEPQSAILSVMGRLVEGVPSVKFLITGRPEPRIQSGFRLGLLRPLTDVFVLHGVDPSIVNADIRLFLEHGLSELAKRRGIERDGWPTDEQLDMLCERAAGLFVYAVATLKFLDHAFSPPNEQLDIIARAPGSTSHEGRAKVRSRATLDSFDGFAPSVDGSVETLDSLYLSSFQGAFNGMDADDDEKVRCVVGTVILAVNPLPPSAIAGLINLGERQVMDLLRLIQSLLKLSDDPGSPVLPFHKSFPDFITDPLRCTNERFHIPPRTGHFKIALSCLKLMNGSLEQNLLSLPDYALNSEVEDLQTRIKDRINLALEYACTSWHHHLIEIKGDVTGIIPTLHNFLQEGFLAWLEVLSVIGATRDAIVALGNLIVWLQGVTVDDQLLETARDYLNFATVFFKLIGISATHIYHSALELSPLSSVVRKFYYYQRPRPSPRVVFGAQESWYPSLPVPAIRSDYLSSTWSPCGQFVAAVTSVAVEIRDALTLELTSTLQSTKVATTFRPGLAYSPDGHSIVGCSDTAIVIWDTQTGGVVKEIERELTGDGLELVWSLDGKAICTISPRVLETLTVRTYDVSSGTASSPGTLQSQGKPYLWPHGESFRIATTTAWERKGWKINTFEVGSTLTKIESYPFQLDSPFHAFSPTSNRISVSAGGDRNRGHELLVVDIRNSEVLLREAGSYGCIVFSPDGSALAALSDDGCLRVWRFNSGRYTRWREFKWDRATFQFSPTLSSILGSAGTYLYVLRLDHSSAALPPQSAITTHNIPRDAYPPHGTYIATTHRGEMTITITNLRSQDPSPSQFIDTDFEILEIVLTGNVLLAKGSDIVVAWLLTEEGVVDGVFGKRRACRNDSLWDMKPRDLQSQSDEKPSFWARLRQPERVTRTENTHLEFSVGDGVATVVLYHAVRSYDTGTGQILKPEDVPLHPKRTWYRFHNPHRDDCDRYHRDSYDRHESPKCGWRVSREGWVKDPEGKRRFALRAHQSNVVWFHDTTTLRFKTPDEIVVVTF